MQEVTRYHRIFAKNIATHSIHCGTSKIMHAPINTTPLAVNQALAIIIDTHRQLIAGKTRLECYQAQHKKKVPVIMVDISALFMGLPAVIDCSALSYSQAIMIACHIEYLVGNRQGQRNDLLQRYPDKKNASSRGRSQQIPAIKPRERTGAFAARCIGSNAKTFRQRKKVVQGGVSELVHAFDRQQVDLKDALTIVKQSTSMRIQRQQLNQYLKK